MKKQKIGVADLKLLADVSYAIESGQPDYLVGVGFGAASKRLQRAGLIVENPTSILPLVRITGDGNEAINSLLDVLTRFAARL